MNQAFFEEMQKIGREAPAYKAPSKKKRERLLRRAKLIGGLSAGMAANIGTALLYSKLSKWPKVKFRWKFRGAGPRPGAGSGPRGPRTHVGRASKSARDVIPGLGGVKSKAEAKAAYKEVARKHHPDLGGDPEKMKDINAAWDDFKRSTAFQKLSMAYWRRMTENRMAPLAGVFF